MTKRKWKWLWLTILGQGWVPKNGILKWNDDDAIWHWPAEIGTMKRGKVGMDGLVYDVGQVDS
jgi:hypothetical protein